MRLALNAIQQGRAKLFGTGFAQVICVSANTVFIAHYQLIANLTTALMLSLIWTWNVKKVAFGDWTDRWVYACGAALGSVAGTIAANHAMGWLS